MLPFLLNNSMHNVLYIEKYKDYRVNIQKLLAEFSSVNESLDEVLNHGNKVLVQKKFSILKCGEYAPDLSRFEYTLEIAKKFKETLDYNSITYRSTQPNTAYNWHTDTGKICYHIPLITNPGSWFVYEHRSFYMPADGSVYIVNNSRPHTFVNAGNEPRIHLTFETLD